MKKYYHHLFSLCLLIFFSSLLISTPANATEITNDATSKNLDSTAMTDAVTPKISGVTSVKVPSVIQAKDHWCWAACAEMAGKSVYPQATRTQYDVVQWIFGNQEDQSGDLGQSQIGSQYVTNDKFKFGIDYDYNVPIETILGHLKRGYPVQASIGATYTSEGHMVVIHQILFIDNSSGSSFELDYIDPSDGRSHHCTYDDFLSGKYNNGMKYRAAVYVK